MQVCVRMLRCCYLVSPEILVWRKLGRVVKMVDVSREWWFSGGVGGCSKVEKARRKQMVDEML